MGAGWLDKTSMTFIWRLSYVKPNSGMENAATVMLFLESQAFNLLSHLGMQMC